eukprot:TRINITY_DN5005_c0_g1_i1.p1 TRINITY_DN5005_c0_g1~~TRINITY_DN5005_c0_g1_i1.p1  ORF type:complete len:528 (+),score=135.82 TRINITY_DN5005_c0_g1_i1:156-1739(+)
MVKVTVKWNKLKYDDVEMDLEDTALTFKAQIYALTGVPIERQKIMGVKGGILKDDANLKSLGIKEGQALMLMGSADEVKEPEKKTVFMEDLTSDQVEEFASLYPPGLVNLGNTCYMNATIQCFRQVPELRDALKSHQGSAIRPVVNSGPLVEQADKITCAMRDLFGLMESTKKPSPPLIFLNTLHQAYPQFAQTSPQGGPMQQDAEECWSQLMQALSTRLRRKKDGSSSIAPSEGSSAQDIDVVTELFTGDMNTSMKNSENEAEPAAEGHDHFRKLPCHISANTNFLIDGLKEALQEPIRKQSPSLGREANYIRTSKISKLPYYLTVQFVRFYWKQDTKTKAKIVRPVEFPIVLDIYDLCTSDLQKSLQPARAAMEAAEEEKLQRERERIKAKALEDDSKGKGKEAATDSMEVTATTPVTQASTPTSYHNNTGKYELIAVLTHKGRSADSGHYVSWVKQADGKWLLFDDDKVREADVEDIKKLSGKGGGDWHMAYLCLYRSLNYDATASPTTTDAPTSSTTTTTTSS